MAKCRNIFFDVGNTLLFPNRARMLAPISADRHPTLESWQALERRTKHEFDQGLMEGRVDRGFWWTFHTYLLQQLNSEDEAVRDFVLACLRHRTSTVADPGHRTGTGGDAG